METIEAARVARQAGDIEGLSRLLASNARYRLVTGSALLPAAFAEQRDAREALAEMIAQFTFHKFEVDHCLIEGDRAALRFSVATDNPEGETVNTEIASFWSFDEEGRITEIVDFVDIALVARLVGSA